VLKNEPYST
jgi:hypothetical protein